jgi:2,3-bisphosphoglycerate-dependent phosphoglycerate mutase
MIAGAQPRDDMSSPFLARRDGAAELYLIRHGDAVPDVEEIVLGGAYKDQPLSGRGRKQAEALADRLKEVTFNTIYSSPLRRTKETAEPLAKMLNLPIFIEEDLREVEFNSLEQVLPPDTPKDVLVSTLRERLFRSAVAAAEGYWTLVEGAEDRQKFRGRVVKVVDEIARRHPGERVAVFAHGGTINVYMAELLGIDRDYFYPNYNTSINIARVLPHENGAERLLLCLNDAAHLFATPGLVLER